MRRTLALWLLLLGVYAAAAGLEDGYAVVAALALALAYRLALRVVPDPWAIGAAAALGLSPPLLAYDTAHTAELAAGAALAGAALLAVRLDTRPGWRNAFGCFALLGALPWLGIEFVPAGVVIGALAARILWRARKRTLAVGAVELSLFSVAVFVGVNEALYESPVPDDALDSSDIDLRRLRLRCCCWCSRACGGCGARTPSSSRAPCRSSARWSCARASARA